MAGLRQVGDGFRESRGTSLYVPTDKVPDAGDANQISYEWLADQIYLFSSGGMTLNDIYHEITGPKGLSLSDTRDLVNRASKAGFIRRTAPESI